MKKDTFIDLDKVKELTKTYPTPFYIYDEKGIRDNALRLKEAFSWNKGFKEYFAIKATPNPYILKILQSVGCGVDCSSMTELMLAKVCGFAGDDIMFSSNETPLEEFKFARDLGGIINLDDITHIEDVEKVLGYFPKTISFRYNPGGIFELGNGIMDNPGEAKYGMTAKQLREAVKICKEKGVERFGLHAFLASNTLGEDYYPTLASILFDEAASIKKELGVSISFVNLSGGIGIHYRPGQKPNNIEMISRGVKAEFDKILVPAGLEGVSVYTELGRYMLGPYGALITRAIHEKHIYKDYIGVDACAVNLMRPAMYGSYHHITVLGKEDKEADKVYDVVGSLCENNDKFAIDRKLPKIDKGDYLYIHDTGAHGYAMGYNYNGKLKCAELLLKEDGSVQLIRRAETAQDYFATLDFEGL